MNTPDEKKDVPDVQLGSSLVLHGGPDQSVWNIPWICYILCGGTGITNPKSQMPRCCDDRETALVIWAPRKKCVGFLEMIRINVCCLIPRPFVSDVIRPCIARVAVPRKMAHALSKRACVSAKRKKNLSAANAR